MNTLAELSPKLRQSVLLIKEKAAVGATADYADELAAYAGLVRGTNAHNDFIQEAMGLSAA